MIKSKGKIPAWNDEKGYGFISPIAGGDHLFMHIKSLANRGRRPAVGDFVTYSVSADAQGRTRAEDVAITNVRKLPKLELPFNALSIFIAIGFLMVVGSAILVSAIPTLILPIYLVISAATFTVYVFDKSAAKKGTWRTSESTLHLLSLAGGWPGALIAQNKLRHKSKKQPFRVIFWATVLLNCAAFVWLLTPEGAKAWHSAESAVVVKLSDFVSTCSAW